MVNETLYKRTLWINKNIEFLFGTSIIEYDIHAAGPSLCKAFKLLPSHVLEELDKMDKKAKNIKIGLIQRRDKVFAKRLSDAFIEARRWFLSSNQLDEEDIVSIKKDAIFVANRTCSHTKFDVVVFQGKNIYTSYLRLHKLEFYLHTQEHRIDVKGLGQGDALKEVLRLHGDYMLSFLMDFCKMRELEVKRSVACHHLASFLTQYRKKELPLGYYRELNRTNSFRVYNHGLHDYVYIADTDQAEDVDITFNYLAYIVPLVNLYI